MLAAIIILFFGFVQQYRKIKCEYFSNFTGKLKLSEIESFA